MKDQNNNNLNSGIDSTTFNRNKNAYENQKQSSLANSYKNTVRNEIGPEILSKATGIDKELLKKGIQKNENKSILQGGTKFPGSNLFNKNQLSRHDELNNSNIETQTNNTKKSSPIGNMLNNSYDNSEAKAKAEKVKRTIKIIKFVAPFIPYIFIILFIILFISSLLILANESLDEVVDGGESVLNLLTLNGYKTNVEVIKDKIDNASLSFSELDKEILYATINNQVLISPNVYDIDNINSTGEVDFVTNPFIDKYNVHTFYNMKENMLGSTTEPGTMIYSLIGTSLDVTCVDSRDGLFLNNTQALTSYITGKFLKTTNVIIDKVGDVYKYSILNPMNVPVAIGTIISTIDDWMSYHNQDSNYLAAKFNELGFALNSIDLQVIEAFANKSCESGTYKKYTSQKINDYSLYYNYIAKVYVPTVYYSVWNTFDDIKKIQVINETWSDIVNVRNATYQAKGINNYLYYDFNSNGEIVTAASTSGIYNGAYVSDIPVGTKGTNWKQFTGSWASMKLGEGLRSNGKTRTMASQGCYITSIAILMANSGTYMTQDTFDPGVLAQTLINNGGVAITGDGSVTSHSWGSLAPNFAYVKGEWNLQRQSKNQISSLISSYLNQGYHVMIQVNSGGHFVAVAGIEAGRIVIADPGKSKTPTYFDDNATYPEGTITSLRIFKS